MACTPSSKGVAVEEKLKLTSEQYWILRQAYLTRPNHIRIPAHILLLLSEGHAPDKVAEITYTSPNDVANAVKSFEDGGIDAIIEPQG